MANAHFFGGLPRLLQYYNPNQFITILNGGGLPNLLQYFIEGGKGSLGTPNLCYVINGHCPLDSP